LNHFGTDMGISESQVLSGLVLCRPTPPSCARRFARKLSIIRSGRGALCLPHALRLDRASHTLPRRKRFRPEGVPKEPKRRSG
jgi:hypothetical protein